MKETKTPDVAQIKRRMAEARDQWWRDLSYEETLEKRVMSALDGMFNAVVYKALGVKMDS
jgi:hypothetical protein